MASKKKGRLVCLFEFGVPHYRGFILKYFLKKFSRVDIVHADDKFDSSWVRAQTKAIKLFQRGENRLLLFNPKIVFCADVIVTTLNVRRPHTWMFVLLCPWKKWIFWGQGVGKSHSWLFRALRRILFKISHGYVVYTEGGRKRLIDAGYDKRKISIAYNTLQVKNSKQTCGDDYFLYVGRIQERKQLELIFPYLQASGKQLVIVGDGDHKQALTNFVNQNCYSKVVRFLPAIYDDVKIKEIFSGAIAYVSPGHVGLGVVHAFSYGVPVITLRNASHAPEFEYCTDDNSYLCGNIQELGNALRSSLKNKTIHQEKRRDAYNCYKSRLSDKNVLLAFDFHFDKGKNGNHST